MKTPLREIVEHVFHNDGDTWAFTLETAGRVAAWRKDGYVTAASDYVRSVYPPAENVAVADSDEDDDGGKNTAATEMTNEQRLLFLVHMYEAAPLAGTVSSIVMSDSDGVSKRITFDHAFFDSLPDQWVDVLVAEAFRLNPHWSFLSDELGNEDDDSPKSQAAET